ncbi:elongator complex protein 1-like [Centruroides sculpturatus]|uniref:elongator complex protein 1-like n=1 Tax=Centruroides sculpturatus TaxID=218467 RepID=UPI000C6E214C|nr:elongator complex protein 1-like [Centruroides sculpturatus]
MRNLKLMNVRRINNPCLEKAKFICLDDCEEFVYFIADSSIYKLDLRNSEIDFCTELDGLPEIIKCTYIIEKQSICLACANGDIFMYDISFSQVESVGSIADGIQDMVWSPDQELIVFVTRTDLFILMSKDFDPVIEDNIHSDVFGENEPISVGWGSKETQFDIKKPSNKNCKEVMSTEFLDKCPCICWRGDGEYFVISATDSSNNRKLRIWNREGILQFTSEKIVGLESTLDWKPSGNLIASSQHFPQKHAVVFFEKNGLQHGEFELPYEPKTFYVNGISWNMDSSILAIWGYEIGYSNSSDKTYFELSLWTTGNYHWYSKYNFRINDKINIVQWDQQNPYKLHVVFGNGDYIQYLWSWSINSSFGQSELDSASVAVIDGKKLLLTPFRHLVVPPPMSAFSMTMPYNIENVIFAPSPYSNNFIICLNNKNIAIVKFDSNASCFDDRCKLEIQIPNSRVQIPSVCTLHKIVDPDDNALLHWTWTMEDRLFVISKSQKNNYLCYIKLKDDEDLVIEHYHKIEDDVINICTNDIGDILAIQTHSGSIYKYDCKSNNLDLWIFEDKHIKFPYYCPKMSIFNNNIIFGLSERFQLYCNDKEVSSNCISFQVNKDFLIYTTYQHSLQCTSMEGNFLDIVKNICNSKNPRMIEKGSKLITRVACDTKVVLQLPRGNLEVIHPRTLIYYILRKLLDKLEFKTAFDLMWKHRINMNFIYDHNPTAFLDNTELFVQQINSVSKINIFIADIRNSSSDPNSKLEAKDENDRALKLNAVYNALLNSMKRLDEEKYLLPILAAHARKIEPELDIVLKKVKSLDNSGAADEALKFIFTIIDVNSLYDVALGTYDFDIILMIAEKSNKDPKEYLPFLNYLNSLDSNYQKFKIDMHLKNYEKALYHISKCKDHFNECVSLICSERLYKEALHIYPPHSEENKKIWALYGDYLMSKRLYEEAGLVYKRCEKFDDALNAFQLCGNWCLMFSIALQLDFGKDKLAELATNSVIFLKNNRRYAEAATLLEQFANKYEESILVLIEGQEWEDAIRLIYKHNYLNLLETHLKPALLDTFTCNFETIKSIQYDFQKKVDRLKVVRAIKLERATYDADDQEDNYSDISSVSGSSHSVKGSKHKARSISTVISKSKKSMKNLYNLKEGSPYEDLALIASLRELISNMEIIKTDMRKLIKTLIFFEYDDESQKLQEEVHSLIELIEKNLTNIWPPENSNEDLLTLGPLSTANTLAALHSRVHSRSDVVLDPELKYPPKMKTVDWKLQMLK